MAEVGILPFARIAVRVCRAVLPRHRSRFSKHQFTQSQLLGKRPNLAVLTRSKVC